MTTPVAPLHMPPFADFIAWLRETPDRVFDTSQRNQCFYCPIAVFVQNVHNDKMIGMKMDGISHMHHEDSFVQADADYIRARERADTLLGRHNWRITASQLLKEIT